MLVVSFLCVSIIVYTCTCLCVCVCVCVWVCVCVCVCVYLSRVKAREQNNALLLPHARNKEYVQRSGCSALLITTPSKMKNHKRANSVVKYIISGRRIFWPNTSYQLEESFLSFSIQVRGAYSSHGQPLHIRLFCDLWHMPRGAEIETKAGTNQVEQVTSATSPS